MCYARVENGYNVSFKPFDTGFGGLPYAMMCLKADFLHWNK